MAEPDYFNQSLANTADLSGAAPAPTSAPQYYGYPDDRVANETAPYHPDAAAQQYSQPQSLQQPYGMEPPRAIPVYNGPGGDQAHSSGSSVDPIPTVDPGYLRRHIAPLIQYHVESYLWVD